MRPYILGDPDTYLTQPCRRGADARSGLEAPPGTLCFQSLIPSLLKIPSRYQKGQWGPQMDPISIISLAGSTTQAAYKISTQLYAFINRVKEADESLLALARELSGLRRSLDAISNILRNPLVRSERATAPENIPIWVAVAGALEDCRKSLEAFEKKVNPHRHEKISHRNVIRKSIAIWKLGLSDADIKTLRDQINTHTNSLQIALQTANVYVNPRSVAHCS